MVETADSTIRTNVEPSGKLEEAKPTNSADKPKNFSEFEITFESENKEHNSLQRLGVTWVTNDSIEFRLLSEDELCDTDYWGTAKNKYADMDPESDEDETGESYLASEYVTDRKLYEIVIRISLDKDRARISYVDKSGDGTDCMPTPNLVLIKKNGINEE